MLTIIMMDTSAWGGFYNLFDMSKIDFLDFQVYKNILVWMLNILTHFFPVEYSRGEEQQNKCCTL